MNLADLRLSRYQTPKALLLSHLAIFSIGLQKIISLLATLIYNFFSKYFLVFGGNDWINSEIHKPIELIQYSLACLITFTLFIFIFHVRNRDNCSNAILKLTTHTLSYITYLVVILFLNLILFFSTPNPLLILLTVVWLAGFLWLPIVYFGIINKIFTLPRKFYYAFSFIFFIQIFAIFIPLIVRPMLIGNDAIDISGYTKLANGKIVDTIEYANAHDIFATRRYDPRIDKGETPPARRGSYIKIANSPLLDLFIEDIHHKYKYTYHPKLGILSINGTMTEDERQKLYIAYRHNLSSIAKIDSLYYLSRHQNQLDKKRIYTSEEVDFIKKNLPEMVNQAKAGYFFYHHNYYFGPMNAIALGADIKQQNIVYGGLSTTTFCKALKMLGGINYQNYFKIFFSSYLIYYFIFFALIFLIFKPAEYAALLILLTTSSILLMSLELLKLAPGFNPIRHIFDILTFYLFYQYLTRSHKMWLISCLLLALFAILWNKEFGLFLFLSISISLFIKEIFVEKGSYLKVIFYLLILTIGVGLYTLPSLGNNPSFFYMLLGVATPTVTLLFISSIMALISLIYMFFIKIADDKNIFKYISFSLFLYSQALFIYFIWYPEFRHLFSIAPILSFFIVSLLYILFNDTFVTRSKRWMSLLYLLALAFIYIPSTVYYYFTAANHQRNFSNHVKYEWNFNNAHFISTMDPSLFRDAVRLIEKYNPENALYIISKYDHLLPILAGKYSAMPYIELPTNLVTTKEVAIAIQAIKMAKPLYLFVDTDIDRNLNTDIINIADPLLNNAKGEWLQMQGKGRVMVMNVLKNVFKGVRSEYEIIDKGYIITVYKRKWLSHV